MHLDSKDTQKISRRGLLPLLGGLALLPWFSQAAENKAGSDNDEYQILLKPDGSTVKVNKSAIKNSQKVKEKLSNASMLAWLKKK